MKFSIIVALMACVCGQSESLDALAGNSNSAGSVPVELSPAAIIGLIRKYLQSGMLKTMVTDAMEHSEVKSAVSHPCLNDTEMIISDLLFGEMYALQFIDADGKVPPGILDGQWAWVGDYQQCNEIVSPFNAGTGHSFKGKYSSVQLYRNGSPIIRNFLPLSIGVCLPDSCNKSEVGTLAEYAISPLSGYNISVAAVEDDETPPYSGGAIAAFIVCGFLLLLVVVGTSVDVLYQRRERTEKPAVTGTDNHTYKLDEVNHEHIKANGASVVAIEAAGEPLKMENTNEETDQVPLEVKKLEEVLSAEVHRDWQPRRRNPFIVDLLRSFSFLNNTTKLLNTSTASGPLACLNGLRVISMWWVIQGHTYEFISFTLDNVSRYSNTLLTRFSFQAIANGAFSVDTFFYLSGLLVAYLTLKEMKKKRGINWAYYFGHRYWRLTPLYACIMLPFTTLIPHAVSGPYKWIVTSPTGLLYRASENCKTYWWTNLLYINNLYPDYGTTSGCMGWGWYLANDMQFYVFLSPIIIILLHKKRKVGWAVSVLLILAGIAVRGWLVSYYGMRHLDGGVTKHKDDPWGRSPLYTHPWTRFTVYLVGMLTGHFILSTKCKVRMSYLVSFIGWVVATGTALAVVYGPYEYVGHPDEQMSLVENGFYDSLNRTAWSLSLAWLTVACVSGHGGWVNSILSWAVWAPLGRLTYAAYLTHPIVIVVVFFNAKTPEHFTDLHMISVFVSLTALTYAVSYVVSMVAEAPMMQLEKVLLKKQKQT